MAAFHVTTRHAEKETTSDIQRRQSYKTYNAHKKIGQSDLNSFTQQNVLSHLLCGSYYPRFSGYPVNKREEIFGASLVYVQKSTSLNVSYSGRVLCLRNYDHLSGVGGQCHFLILTEVYYGLLDVMQVVSALMEGSSVVRETLNK